MSDPGDEKLLVFFFIFVPGSQASGVSGSHDT